jgi:large subunit ribosomal protein L23
MSIFSKKTEEEKALATTPEEETTKTEKKEKKAKASKESKRTFSSARKNILKKPWITEKAFIIQAQNNQYVFGIEQDANKKEVQSEIERTYGVHVEKINIVRKKVQKRAYRNIAGGKTFEKKAIVSVKKGEKIDIE